MDTPEEQFTLEERLRWLSKRITKLERKMFLLQQQNEEGE